MLWSSSGRRYASASTDHIYSLASHHALSLEATSRGITGSCGIAFLRVAIQHPGSSSPPSLLREGRFSLMWIASLSISSLGVLAWSIIVASSHLIGWWFSHACSARADFSSVPSDKHPGAPSFSSQASSVSPQCRSRYSCMGLGTPPWTSSVCPSTLVSMEHRDSPDLKTTFTPNFL